VAVSDSKGWRRTAGRAAIGIVAFLVFQYATALWRLATRSGGVDSKFGELALQEHRGFVIGQNLQVLVAYVLLGVAAWLLLMPLLSRLGDRRSRWVVPAAFFGCVVLHGFFMFRLAYSRPYFMGDADFGDWYYGLLELPPEAWRAAVHRVVFEVLPWLALALAAWWWWRRLSWPLRGVVLVGGLVVAVVVAWPWLSRLGASRAQARSEAPNILIIGSDSLRGDRLGYMGYRPARGEGAAADGVSPRIDRWAEEAAVFERCWTPASSTLESGISLMTSLDPRAHGIRQMFPMRGQVESLEGRVTTLAEVLAAEGYDTAAIGDWCASYYEVTPLGFEEVDVSSFDSFRIYVSQAVIMAHFVVPIYFDNPLGYRLFPQVRSFAQFVTPEVVTRRVERRIEDQAASGRPFFWHVFYSLNHLPYRSAEPYNRMFADPDYEGPNRTGVDFDIDEFIGGTGLEEKWAALPRDEVEQIRALYDGCTRQFDDCFARILDALERHGLLENTIVILTSDHGDDLYEPGVTLGHGLGFSGADGSFRVPLALRGPGVPRRRFDEQVTLLEVAPTVAGLVDVGVPDSWRGEDLSGWWREPGRARDLPFYAETQFPFIQFKVEGVERPELPPMDELTFIDPEFNHHFVLRPEHREAVLAAKQACLRTGDWKLVATPTVAGELHHQLFHTASDPHCLVDLAAARPRVLRPMREALERWREDGTSTPIEAIFPRGEPVGGGEFELSPGAD